MATPGPFDHGCTTPLVANNNWVVTPRSDHRFSPRNRRSPVPEVFLTRKRKEQLSPRRLTPTKFQRIEDASPNNNSNKKSSDRFQSVLDRPFVHWKEFDSVLATLFPEWSHYQRGRIIHHLIHFLELKIGLNEFIPEGLLSPSPVVDTAWRAILLETQLYQKVLKHIQDFHGKPRKMVHYSIYQRDNENKLRRTQSLFQVYFLETMPLSIDDEQQPSRPTALHQHLRQSSFDSSSHKSDSSTLPPQLRQPILQKQSYKSSSNIDDHDEDASVTSATTLYGLGLVDEMF